MPVVTIKGGIDFMKWTEMLAWYDAHVGTQADPDFDQFILDCAVRGFEEVKKDVQVQRRV